ncbi:hypothetical protein MVES1_002250 [Malassezia vespertilionis]|nr:uncharacterized protein MVES1_002250 [Malassezia vespertilionis]WFD06895.1 hypothetical protein MVES1_002250 [Malassezia vespertilionis]
MLLILCGAIATFGLYLVLMCEVKIGRRVDSFYEMANLVLPQLAWYFDAAIFIKCFGVGISYLMISGQLMTSVIRSLAQIAGGDADAMPAWVMSKTLWVMLFLFILSPVCFYRRLDSLRGVGYLNMVAVAYLLITVLYFTFSAAARATLPPRGEIKAAIFSADILRAFPIIVFAYTCAQNILPVYNELEQRTIFRCNLVSILSLSSSAFVYLVIALAGYGSFGSSTGDNIIAMYPDGSLLVCIGKASVIVLTLTSYPMQLYPSRTSLNHMLQFIHNTHHRTQESSSLMDQDAHSPRSMPTMSNRRWNTLTIGIMAVGTLIAMVVSDLSLVLGIVGSIGSTTISFILPALLYRELYRDNLHTTTQKAALGLAIWGTLVLVLALTMNVVRIIGL